MLFSILPAERIPSLLAAKRESRPNKIALIVTCASCTSGFPGAKDGIRDGRDTNIKRRRRLRNSVSQRAMWKWNSPAIPAETVNVKIGQSRRSDLFESGLGGLGGDVDRAPGRHLIGITAWPWR